MRFVQEKKRSLLCTLCGDVVRTVEHVGKTVNSREDTDEGGTHTANKLW